MVAYIEAGSRGEDTSGREGWIRDGRFRQGFRAQEVGECGVAAKPIAGQLRGVDLERVVSGCVRQTKGARD